VKVAHGFVVEPSLLCPLTHLLQWFTPEKQERHMIGRRPLIAALATCVGAVTFAHAQAPKAASPDQIAQNLPVDIPEVIVGGGWQANGLRGIYRGVVVVTPAETSTSARVYVQWIGVKADGSTPQIVNSIAIPEIAAKNLANAQLSIDAEKDNEAMFVVTTYDTKTQKPDFFAFKATLPGELKAAELPVESTQGAQKR
jgi:hypothetical protein